MRAAALQHYLKNKRSVVCARLMAATEEDSTEVIDFIVDVDLPQRPLYPIHKTERIRVRFPQNDAMPQAFALRKDFPATPHMIMTKESYPRQLCLYERSWLDERENWSPRSFVERIRRWLSGTADGTLHRDDQALEPVMFHSPYRLALPEIPPADGDICRIERFFIEAASADGHFFLAYREKPVWFPADATPIPSLVVQGPTVHHGIIHETPATLGDLEKLLQHIKGSLVNTIFAQISTIRGELKKLEKKPLLLILRLPKRREKSSEVETVEQIAFLIDKEVGELFKVKEIQVKEGSLWVPKKLELFQDTERLKNISLLPLSVRQHLSATSAAHMNGHMPSRIKTLAIGAGALGSQIINNLWRGGFGNWTIVDNDDLDAHNPARHLLTSHAVGRNKAKFLSAMMQSIFPDSVAPSWIACDYLMPNKESEKLSAAMQSTELILDFSASVTVERRLAGDRQSSARRMTAFLNQRGDESVLLVEDTERKINLFWLEAEYTRAVAFNEEMRGHFDNVDIVAHRYGNGCRDISTTVSQDRVALHAGLLSHYIRRATAESAASIVINRWSDNTGIVKFIKQPVITPKAIIQIGNWLVQFHESVIDDMIKQRTMNLPNETGGILLGVADREQHSLAIMGMLPAPPDSDAWPTSFIRGSGGLAVAVDKISKRTLGNMIYAGEWHSHPTAYDSTPSVQDIAAVALCAPNMDADALPTVMLIIADNEACLVLRPPHQEEIRMAKIAI